MCIKSAFRLSGYLGLAELVNVLSDQRHVDEHVGQRSTCRLMYWSAFDSDKILYARHTVMMV